MSRPTLAALRLALLEYGLDDDFQSVTVLEHRIGLSGGSAHARVALVLERLVVDGDAEIERARTRRRRYRLRVTT
jgi:hypothetical protein